MVYRICRSNGNLSKKFFSNMLLFSHEFEKRKSYSRNVRRNFKKNFYILVLNKCEKAGLDRNAITVYRVLSERILLLEEKLDAYSSQFKRFDVRLKGVEDNVDELEEFDIDIINV